MSATAPKPVKIDPATLIDVAVISQAGSLDWLSSWQPLLHKYHILVISEGPSPSVPAGFANLNVVSRKELEGKLGASGVQLGSRELAILASKKPYLLFLDEGSSVAKTPQGKDDDAIAQHLTNLQSPATPFFFNTLYDPFRPGADFVRGYPFSLREGVPTAVSHGLWLNYPDYDAATHLAKSQERNSNYVDLVTTVPKGVLFNVSGRNLAINKSLIGVAFFSGLDADGHPQGDANWAGFCSKVVADHLGYGVKTGIPYITANKPAGAAPPDMEKEYKNLKHQAEVVSFFQSVKLSPESTTPDAAYLELAKKVRETLGTVDAHFTKVAAAMEAWVTLFKAHA